MENLAEIRLLIPFSKLPKQELSQEESVTLMALTTMNLQHAKMAYKEMLADENAWQLVAVEKRINLVLKLKVCEKTKLWISYYGAEHGFAYILTMYYYLKYWSKQNKITEITFDTFCQNIFPSGFPDRKKIFNLWDLSKVLGNPVIDNGAYCASFLD